MTAQKREQSVQDVPIAVSAFSEEFLEDANVDDVLELQFFAPGVSIFNGQNAAATSINVRGVGTAGNSISLEPSVGLYSDGVYRGRQSSATNDLVDIERIEILKGPQGTLFGKNTASGAIQFLTRKPVLDSVGGFLELEAGSESHRSFKGAINLPLVEGTSAIRLTGSTTDRDGFVKNLTTGTDTNDRNRHSLRGQFLWSNSEDLSVRIIADSSKIDEVCCSGVNIFDGPGDTTALFLAAGRSLTSPGRVPNISYVFPLDVLATLVGETNPPVVLAADYHDDVVRQDVDPYAKIEESGVSLEVNWDISDNMTFTSVTATRSYESEAFADADFHALNVIGLNGSEADIDTFTQEFRIDGTWNDNVNYVAGVYYFDQELDNFITLRLGTAAPLALGGGITTAQALGGVPVCAVVGVTPEVCNGPAFPAGEGSDNISTQKQTSWAVFGQADWNLSEDLVATFGLRYLDEEKDMDVLFTETIFTPVFNGFTALAPNVTDVNGVEFDDNDVTGTLKLSYFWENDVMTYLSYGRGYKSGGTNVDRISPATGAPLIFDPEISDSLELGLKGNFFDSRMRLNLALHRTNFEDFQANTFVGTGFVLQNAGEIEANGFEADLMVLVNEWLTIAGGTAYVDAEYESFAGGSCTRTPINNEPDAGDPQFPTVCDAAGNTVGGTPEWTHYLSVISERELGDGVLFGRWDISYRDDLPAGTDNDPNKEGDARTLSNINLGYRFADGKYTVTLWGKNVFDEDYQRGGFNSVIRQGSLSAFHTDPATYGLTFRANFD